MIFLFGAELNNSILTGPDIINETHVHLTSGSISD
jgi:hypothetical protein